MWNQGDISGTPRRSAGKWKNATLQILPCTVSQLLSAPEISNDTFAVCDRELNQVSVVGVIRGLSPFKTNVQYSVDDMTGPPLNVKQWVNKEDCAAMADASPGTYVKVTGSLRNFKGQRYLMAMNIHCIEDMNEITSHMLEVVQAHMQLTGKVYDVNMNTSLPSLSGSYSSGHPKGLSTIQDQVFNAIRKSSDHDEGISFNDLKTQLHFLRMTDIRSSLTFLLNEGEVFCTIDEHHFKTTGYN
ncbi:replication protein A 32 kDa subunit-like [Hippoglossus hippoglossus]|uniref:replication protein A 32 kDa subunit-like n=1 Tax=Hippoglossus hippoglossus TaxID=8267 RepID=UPI00148D1158|nr:replication protein A 32 kDa subunit-like [Hippoglossus hippoglossus]